MHFLSSITAVFLPTLKGHAQISILFKCCTKNPYVFLLLFAYNLCFPRSKTCYYCFYKKCLVLKRPIKTDFILKNHQCHWSSCTKHTLNAKWACLDQYKVLSRYQNRGESASTCSCDGKGCWNVLAVLKLAQCPRDKKHNLFNWADGCKIPKSHAYSWPAVTSIINSQKQCKTNFNHRKKLF